MTEHDRVRWDERYAERAPDPAGPVGPPDVFAPYQELFPMSGRALDLACGQGRGSVWLATRGMTVWGVDVSPVAIGMARELAALSGVGDRCRFDVVDLDEALPPGPPVELILCHRFRDARLDRAIVARLAPGGLIAISALSVVGADPGPFRIGPGELTGAFADLDHLAAGEGAGEAWLLARYRTFTD